MVCYLIQVKPAQILTLMEYQCRSFASEWYRKEMDTAVMLRIDPVVKIGTRLRLPFKLFC